MTGTPTIYFDVDNTLIMHLDGAKIGNDCVSIEVWGMTTYVRPHEKHIITLKKYKFIYLYQLFCNKITKNLEAKF